MSDDAISLRTRQRLLRQLQQAGVRDPRVLAVMTATPRQRFLDEALTYRAWEDTALPIGHGQTLSRPAVVARMTEVLLEGHTPRKVLEVGAGSGYQSAVLAQLVEQVFAVERVRQLAQSCHQRLKSLGYTNVLVRHGDGHQGWAWHAPYQGIIITAAAAGVPEPLLAQLAPGGRLVAPVGSGQTQYLVVVDRRGGVYESRTLDPVSFVPLLEGVG